MTFQARRVDASFKLAAGLFGPTLNDTVTYSGLRCEASINNIAGASLNSLQLRIYGMSESVMSQLSTIGISITLTPRNLVTLSASNSSGGMSQVFQGTIANAWIDYSGAPDVSFNVEAYAGLFEQVKSVAVNSYKGSVAVADIISALAKSIGFAFTNNGVTAQLSNPYFAGSALTQIKDCAEHAKIGYDISNGMVQIWPSGGAVDDVSFLISPETGLVGYPVFSKLGIDIQAEFNADIKLGRRLQVRSSVPQACRDTWYCQMARHEISAQVPNGPWFTYAQLAGEGVHVVTR